MIITSILQLGYICNCCISYETPLEVLIYINNQGIPFKHRYDISQPVQHRNSLLPA